MFLHPAHNGAVILFPFDGIIFCSTILHRCVLVDYITEVIYRAENYIIGNTHSRAFCLFSYQRVHCIGHPEIKAFGFNTLSLPKIKSFFAYFLFKKSSGCRASARPHAFGVQPNAMLVLQENNGKSFIENDLLMHEFRNIPKEVFLDIHKDISSDDYDRTAFDVAEAAYLLMATSTQQDKYMLLHGLIF